MLYDRRVDILSLRRHPGGTYEWRAGTRAWAGIEMSGRTNLFSKVGLGARTVIFRMHPRALSLDQMLSWAGGS